MVGSRCFSTVCSIWPGIVISSLHTASARLVTRYRLEPVAVQIRAWAWLAAETDDLAEKERCLEAVLALDPSLDWAQAALTRVWYYWRRENPDSQVQYGVP